eukprot:6380026-Prorocentrum_lima.AAC.1
MARAGPAAGGRLLLLPKAPRFRSAVSELVLLDALSASSAPSPACGAPSLVSAPAQGPASATTPALLLPLLSAT